MLSRTSLISKRILIASRTRTLCSKSDGGNKEKTLPHTENPFTRTARLLKDDMKKVGSYIPFMNRTRTPVTKTDDIEMKDSVLLRDGYDDGVFQTHCDILVIGGGGMGSSIAYWLKKRARKGLHVVVVEKDKTYSQCSTALSVGGLRQQFSLEENIQMSLYGADFIRNIKENFEDGDIDVNFIPNGYLFLASEEGAETLMKNSKLQRELGAKNEILTAKRLKEKFPWLNTNEIAIGCHGLEKEGWFDPWSLLSGFKNAARKYGAHYQDGEVVGFQFKQQRDMMMQGVEPGSYEGLDKVIIKDENGDLKTIKFAICVLAAGAQSGKISRLAKIGLGSEMLSVPLPVEPRKRYVYVFDCENSVGPGLNCPLVIDPTSVYFRKDGLGGNYIAGRSPRFDQEPACDDLSVDYDFFNSDIWPVIANRVPDFERIKCKSAWAGYYEENTFDQNGIIGPHPYYSNMYIATGFSGHGIQQAPAVGRAISELIIDGDFQTIDLSRLCFDRLIIDQPMVESNIW